VEVQSFLARRWLLRLPSPFTPEELQTAYRYELAFGQLEISETSVFDRPQADFNRLTPETLRAVNELVVQIAVDLGLEEGQKLRVDTTVDVATLCYTSLSL